MFFSWIVHEQTFLKLVEIVVQFLFLSSYRSDWFPSALASTYLWRWNDVKESVDDMSQNRIIFGRSFEVRLFCWSPLAY